MKMIRENRLVFSDVCFGFLFFFSPLFSFGVSVILPSLAF